MFDTVFPVMTLLLGAWLANLSAKSAHRRVMQFEAADLLAEVPGKVWAKGEDGALREFQLLTTRLKVRLALAGMPPAMTDHLLATARDLWDAIETEEDPTQGRVAFARADEHGTFVSAAAKAAVWLTATDWMTRRMAQFSFWIQQSRRTG